MNRAVAVVAVVLLAVTGCSDDPPPESAAQESGLVAVDELTDRYLSAAPADVVRQTVTGHLDPGRRRAPGILEIVEVLSGTAGTTVTWRLRPAGGRTVRLRAADFQRNPAEGSGAFTGVSLSAGGANVVLEPGVYRGADRALECTCSPVPDVLGPEGARLSGLYPPLPPGVTSIDVLVPGFFPVSVPVTRPEQRREPARPTEFGGFIGSR